MEKDHIFEPDYFGLKSYLKTHNLFGLQYIYGTLSNSDGTDALDYRSSIKACWNLEGFQQFLFS